MSLDEAVAYALGREDTARFTPPARQPDPPAGSGITRREWQICELIAEGLSNREIAARLTISQRTAESHVQHALDKLGFANRRLIGAWVAQRRGSGE
jgi:non-specific serine/threonine protein kinase